MSAVVRSVASGAVATLALCLAGVGCGSARPEPKERDIWHEASLRPGRVPADTQGERKLLAHLSDMPSNEPMTFGGQVFVADEPYAAASGKRCRSVTIRSSSDQSEAAEVKLACKGQGGWHFVPDPFAEGASPRAEARREP